MSLHESASTPPLTPSEERSISALLAELHEAWRQRDLDTYLAHFADDADLVNRGGMWMRGKVQIRQQFSRLLQRGFPEIFTATATVEAIRPIAPGVITVHERRDEPMRKSHATYLIARRDGHWRIESITIAPIEPAAVGRDGHA